jgi:hypothetical protein
MSYAPNGLLTVGVVVPKRHLFRTGLHIAAVLATTVSLAACAGMNVPFYGKVGDAEPQAEMAAADAASPQTAPVEVASIDPLNVSPPGAPVAAARDPLLVPPPGAVSTDSSQRVPLGTFGPPPPASGAPMPITQPPVKQQAAAPTESKLEQPASAAPVIQPRATTTPPTPAPVTPASPPEVKMAAPAVAAPAPAEAPKAPVLRLPPGKSNSAVPVERTPTTTYEPQETVIISSDSATPIFESREFIPASVVPTQPQTQPRSLSDIPMTAGEKNVVQRFETLRRLQDEALITQEEYMRRRNANIGALLPYTRDPAGMGLERSVPSSDAIIARLLALRRSFEMRAITGTQHALERSMILNALLPETPDERTDRRPPPEDVIEGAAMVGRLEAMRAKNLITNAELDTEKNAIEHVLRTGLLPSQDTGAGGNKAAAKNGAAAQAKTASATGTAADAGPQEITGPVLHLASFRSEDAAQKAWQEALGGNKAALASLRPVIRRIDLGPEKGIFYRLMTGPFKSLSDAEAVCIQLKQNNQFCRASADGS